MPRWANKIDATQAAIVKALREAGVQVWVIQRPVDLLTYHRGKWLPIECKTPKRKDGKWTPRTDQQAQTELIDRTAIPCVLSPTDALKALGLI